MTPILEEIATEVGVSLNIEPLYRYAGQIPLPDGRFRYFRGTSFDVNPAGASDIAKDKAYAAYFIQGFGYQVVEGDSFFTPEWSKVIESDRGPDKAYAYARQLGLPVVVKPNSLSQGALVSLVYTKREFMSVVSAIAKRDRVFLVQRLIRGRDYRIVVLDGQVISAYERLPLSVTGDGSSSVAELLAEKQESFRRIGRDTIIKVDDPRIARKLKRSRLTLAVVPEVGQIIQLLDNANLSSGGDAVDVTSALHHSFSQIATKLTEKMGLRFCGVDLMVEGGISDPVDRYYVLEVNAAPGLDNYAQVGERQAAIVKDLYREVFNALLR